jgi:hypothetical protein
MNERIRELADQARKYAHDYVADCKHYGHYMEHNELEVKFEEKFAELIIKKCMDIAKQVENEKFEVSGSAEPEYRKGINDGRRNAAWGIKNRMKLHFGVEE